jgi:hypothetical protein
LIASRACGEDGLLSLSLSLSLARARFSSLTLACSLPSFFGSPLVVSPAKKAAQSTARQLLRISKLTPQNNNNNNNTTTTTNKHYRYDIIKFIYLKNKPKEKS